MFVSQKLICNNDVSVTCQFLSALSKKLQAVINVTGRVPSVSLTSEVLGVLANVTVAISDNAGDT